MRAAREARGARRSATAGEDAMAGMIYSLREFRRYTDALAVVAAVGCRLDDEPTLHHHQPIESPGETHESGKIRDPGCGVRLVSRLRSVKGTREAHNRKQTPPRRRLGFTQGSRPSDLGRARREPSSSSATFRT